MTNGETKLNTEDYSGNSNSTATKNEVTDFERQRFGYDLRKTKSELIAEYRKNVYNIYDKIIEDLRPLFFALY